MEDTRDYGNDVRMHRQERPGHNPEYRVLVGKFVIKTYSSEEEADDYAQKLAERKRAAKH